MLLKKASKFGEILIMAGVCLLNQNCCGASRYSITSDSAEQGHQGFSSTPPQVTASDSKRQKESMPKYLGLEEIRNIDIKKTLSSYMAQDSLWVEGHPLVVNHEFDFQVAMSIPNVGAGLAVKKRKDMNQRIADKLAALPAFDLEQAFERDMMGDDKIAWDQGSKKLGLYGFLFLGAKGRLEAVLEVQESAKSEADASLPETSLRIVVVSDSLYSADDDSWTTSGALKEDMQKGAVLLGRIYKDFSQGKLSVLESSSEPDEELSCPLGGNERIEGRHISGYGDSGVVLYRESPKTLVFCGTN